ncbi:MAG: hypothetical protein R2682_08670 [Pyrinomonadaceae bacterium]
MRTKILNGLVILTSLLGYLEWGADMRAFLFQAEWEVLRRLSSDPLSVIHPFTLIPLLGQVLLLITLFQRRPGAVLTLVGIACLMLLLGLVCFIGLISLNVKIFASTIPFLTVAVVALFSLWRSRRKGKDHSNE